MKDPGIREAPYLCEATDAPCVMSCNGGWGKDVEIADKCCHMSTVHVKEPWCVTVDRNGIAWTWCTG